MDITQSHFQLFGLPERYAIDRKALDEAYRRVLSRVHPDRFAASGDAEKRIALQWATQANEAYRILKDEVGRARYLCELRGIALEVETNTAMPAVFLMQQMEWREALEEAETERDADLLGRIEGELTRARAAAIAEVGALLDGAADPVATVEAVRGLLFLDRFAEDVANALDRIESSVD
jgi:molecular chaperone HscB